MIFALLFFTVIVFCGAYIFYYKPCNEIQVNKNKYTFSVLIIAGLFIRIIAAFLYEGHPTDMSCFNGWSTMLKESGFFTFYSSDSFTDYPPGYMYILYLLSFIKNMFGDNTIFTYVILKLPAIICDILIAVCLYEFCKSNNKEQFMYILPALFLFNPAVILNSAVWGQVDSVFTLLVILVLIALTKGKTIPAYFIFAVAVFVKPQALFYAPLLLLGALDNVFIKGYSKKKLLNNILGCFGAALTMILLAVPFGIGNVVSQYLKTLDSYNYASVNAYNFWAGIGKNWGSVDAFTSFVGYTSIFLAVIAVVYLFFKKHTDNKYFLLSAFICLAVFTFSVKMHERYVFPVMPLLLFAVAISGKKEEILLYMSISLLQFINTFYVLFHYTPETAFNPGAALLYFIVGWLTVLTLIIFIFYLFKGKVSLKMGGSKLGLEQESKRTKNMTRTDIFAMSVITLVYSIFALYNLGDFKAPQTFETLHPESPMVFELAEETDISKINIYLGAQHIDESKTMQVSGYNANNELAYYEEITDGSVFCWESYDVSEALKYIELHSPHTLYIGEVAALDKNNGIMHFEKAPQKTVDEQELVAYTANYRNGTYFDEIYHARTAYEFIEELPVYEWTHPPLGKTFISLGVKLFGMTPFGWRIIGTLFGILMLPVLYLFTKQMFGATFISVLSTIIFSTDFMHFTQTRIATIDVYVTFFIMLMYMMMYMYIDNDKTSSKSLACLGLSGLFMGLGVACKWTGAYAGIGLAVIFFANILIQYKNDKSATKNIFKTIYFCLFAFVIVPLIIYTLSYIPFIRANDGSFYDIIQNQIDILAYHGNTVLSSTHPFSSPWYQWIVDYRPIWYYTGTNGSLSENISAFGNPLIWWTGILAFAFCVYDAIKYKNKNAAFLVIAYLAQLLPWTFVERITFIYHYFPCVPFLILMLAHLVDRIYPKFKNAKTYFIIFTIVSVLLFIMFYPVISGFPVDAEYVRNFLKWLPSWHLIG